MRWKRTWANHRRMLEAVEFEDELILCTYIAPNGKQCKNFALADSDRCKKHQEKRTEET